MSEEKSVPLCYRCEWRALFFEKGIRPRCECGDIKSAVSGCYMFRPCKPIVVAPSQKDVQRPLSANYLSCRFKGIRIAEDALFIAKPVEDGTMLYWEPKS